MQTCRNVTVYGNRRDFLRHTAVGFGWLALTALHADWSRGESGPRSPLAPRPPHHPARAKRAIFLFMSGGPSHLDTFDWKPALAKAGGRLLPPQFAFKPAGQSGLMIAEVFPHLARHADKLCLLHGMTTNNPGHQQAVVALHTGSETFVRPSMGAWIVYGLGTLAEDLPGFVTIDPISDLGGAQNYGSAFLPATFQGTRLSSGGRGVPNIAARHLSAADQRRQIDFIQRANRRLLASDPGHSELEGLIESYELASKMQTSIPQTLDLSQEPKRIRDLYGLDDSRTQQFGTQCLMARRLAEKGVRFIQLTSTGWDHHNQIRRALADRAAAIDRPIAGLLTDLQERGLLDETLVIWGGEFGRGAYEDNPGGRGHANKGFTMWLAGGGVRGGFRYGATDEWGIHAVEGRMSIADLHATILYLLGLDHRRLTFRFAGRDFRLTDTSGQVATAILA
ncbi:MAG: DUF1501 domain-containing protein [Gemmataceae bacterium]|nr:DUF1501 domain-containing protein [Gemmataceae bacterium]MDW8265144.1 DUF1501 domain-containing protein [Gemmataceae bacterium]